MPTRGRSYQGITDYQIIPTIRLQITNYKHNKKGIFLKSPNMRSRDVSLAPVFSYLDHSNEQTNVCSTLGKLG